MTRYFTHTTRRGEGQQKRAISSLPERPGVKAVPVPPPASPPAKGKGKKEKGKKRADWSKPPLSELLEEIEDQV